VAYGGWSLYMARYRRYWIGFAVAVVLLGAYALAGFLAVPHFARNELQEFVRTHYGRTLSIGEIHFNPFTFNLDVTRLSLPDTDGQRLVSFERLHVDFELAATLWRLGAATFGEIVLKEPYVRAVIRRDGALNLADLGKGLGTAPAKPARPSAPLRLYIGRLAVLAGGAEFEDRSRPTPFSAEFKPIAFELHDFSTTGRRNEDAYTFEAASPEGERLRWSGTLRLEPLISHGAFEITDLKAHTVWNYLRASLPFEIDSGVIGLKGEYDLGSAAGGLGVRVDVHTASVSRLGVRPKGGAEHYLDVGDIAVDDTHVDLTSRRVEVRKVTLTDGDIKAWMSEQGELNLLQLLHPSGASGAPATDASASPAPATPAGHTAGESAWRIAVPEVTVERFKVSAEDRRMHPSATLLLSPLRVHVAGFSTSPDDTLDVTLETGVNESGKLNVRAKAATETGALSAHIEASDLALTMLQPYIAHYTSMTLLQGKLGSRLDVDREADGTLKVKGNTFVADLRTVDNALKQDFIKWKGLRIADMSYVSEPALLRIGSITALEPYARIIIAPDRTVNVEQILTPPGSARSAASGTPAASDTVAPPPSQGAPQRLARRKGAHSSSTQTAAVGAGPVTPFPVSIGAVRLVDGSANYADLWIKPSFAIGIQSLGGTVGGLSSDPRSRAKVQLDGKVERYSPISIAGTVNLLSAALYTDIRMSFKDLDLTVVNPYSGFFTGWRIDKGKLSVDVSYQVDQRKLTAAQHFVVDQLEIGDRVDAPGGGHLPLKLAVALLKDRNGVIDLNLPMSGSLDDPTFRIGPILWKVFVNLIVKAATAPFALLGHLFGGGEHMNVVEFQPGSADIDPPAKDQLASLARALQGRPQLKLDVPIVYSKELDRPRIASRRLREELLTRVLSTREGKKHPDTAGEIALTDPGKHYALLVEQFHADLGQDTPLPPSALSLQVAKGKETPPYDQAINDLDTALTDHIAVPDSDLEALGKDRALAIQNALAYGGQVEAARIFIVNAPQKPDSGDTVKVEMSVK